MGRVAFNVITKGDSKNKRDAESAPKNNTVAREPSPYHNSKVIQSFFPRCA